MKLWFFGVLFFLSTQTFASEVIAKREWTIYFSPRPQTISIELSSKGEITAFTKLNCNGRSGPNCQPTNTIQSLGVLNSEVQNQILKKIEVFEGSKLVDLQEGEPICADAPVTSYWIYNSQNPEGLLVGQNANCHDYGMLISGVNIQVIALLDGFATLLRE
jgi:hypothetical protein